MFRNSYGSQYGNVPTREEAKPSPVQPSVKKKDNKEYEEPLIKIELDTIDSVPRVCYKGKELDWLVDLKLNWTTNTEELGASDLHVSHLVGNSKVGYVHNKLC